MYHPERFDVIVVGGGHAGIEAAHAAARCGCRTILLTHNIETIGQMSCNPSIGGIGKGHLVKEVDALGGLMAKAIDRAGIHFRILNQRKGPAVRATRAQADRTLYKQAMREMLENTPNLTLFQQVVDDLIIENDRVVGVETQMGLRFSGETVVITAGTFLAGKVFIGLDQYEAGRAGDPASVKLAKRLREGPFNIQRLKTGTPPRLDGNSLDWDKLTPQPGDEPTPVFSLYGDASEHPQQINCYITHTNERTHEIIRSGLDRSPLYTGIIDGIGPRYCPSIEDKIMRFSDKSSHQVFVEPEGLDTCEIYPNGISTSLPFDIQYRYVQSISGFENARIVRPGYAIEYDFIDPTELYHTLESRLMEGLYFAGQVNGTTGYEEAAAQGLLAGLNAALKVQGKEAWWPARHEAYIGVMVDDLINNGVDEPYRMFTSRAEFRLLLREDNADTRLTEKGREMGIVPDELWQKFETKQNAIEKARSWLKDKVLVASKTDETEQQRIFGTNLTKDQRFEELLRRPQVNYHNLISLADDAPELPAKWAEQLEIEIKYAGYVERQREEINRSQRLEAIEIPHNFDFDEVSGLSNELKAKLRKYEPSTLGEASGISGMTPAAISLMAIYIKRAAANRPVLDDADE